MKTKLKQHILSNKASPDFANMAELSRPKTHCVILEAGAMLTTASSERRGISSVEKVSEAESDREACHQGRLREEEELQNAGLSTSPKASALFLIESLTWS